MRYGFFLLIGLLALVLAIGLAGQDKGGDQVRVLRLAHGLNIQHPVHRTMEWMAQRVKELSGGKLIIQIFPNEQLGNEKECIEALQLGYLAMTKTSSGPLEGFVPRLRIFGIPYLFRDSEHFWAVALGPIGKELLLAGEQVGLRGLCYYDAGARSFYAKKPIYSPADLKGMKIRVMNSVMAVDMIRAMGGSATPIAWGELYTSLDQGVVDAAENNPPSFETSRHYDICKYYILDEHLRLPDILVISSRVWKSLTRDQQQILQQAVDESVEYGRKLWAEAEAGSLAKVQQAGVQVIRPEKRPFQESVRPIWERYLNATEGEDAQIARLIRQIQQVQAGPSPIEGEN